MAKPLDYHFLLLAPGLSAAWFFQAARHYWDAFRPLVVTDLDLLGKLPQSARTAVTVLVKSDAAAQLRDQIVAETPPSTLLDIVIVDDLPLAELILSRRAESGQPFSTLEGAS